jgi:hypothetical protein
MPINQPTVRVLVATSRVEVHTALETIAPYQATEAVTTRGVYHAYLRRNSRLSNWRT